VTHQDADSPSFLLSRILLDLSECRLDDSELEAIEAWLLVDAPTPPRQLVEAVAKSRPGVYAPV
jgi:hypothetical protein